MWDGLSVFEEINADGSKLRRWSNGVELLAANGAQTGKRVELKDHLGSVRAVVNESGALTHSYDYDAWGTRVRLDGNATPDWDWGFTGHRHHGSGLILAPFRVYDPETGRWISPDPIEEAGGLDLYGYCAGDPVNYYDPDGLDPKKHGFGRSAYYTHHANMDFVKKLTEKYINHPAEGVQCAVGAQFTSGGYGEDGKWHDAADTSSWFRGKKVSGNRRLKPGTVIGYGWRNGLYPGASITQGRTTPNHAAIYSHQDADNIYVYDQWEGKPLRLSAWAKDTDESHTFYEVRSTKPSDETATECEAR